MKPSTFFLLLLLSGPTSAIYTPEALDYILRCIEYEASVAGGTLSLILYDLAPQYPFNNILSAILQSPRLEHVLKYVVNGSYHQNLVNLPWHPSMLLIHPGYDVAHLVRSKTSRDMKLVLELFNPTAKALVFVDFNNWNLLGTVFKGVFNVGFASMVFFDSVKMCADVWNRISGLRWTRAPPPMYLFTWIRRSMTGVNITYYRDLRPLSDWDWNVRWVKEVARYLNTKASQYLTYCDSLTGVALQTCLSKQKQQLSGVDLKLEVMQMRPDTSREFAALASSVPLYTKIAIPRDRPLNVAELLVMPFSWNVWLLLVLVLVLVEVMKLLFPDLLRNDPTMLVVCGFERQSLHRAGSFEKILLVSLIILMFFASNAFESKMLSMMVSKPAIQRIKTLDDLLNSDIKFYEDLEAYPHIANQYEFGKMFVQGSINVFDTVPGVGLLVGEEVADVLDLTAFDYERMEPWYVVLDIKYQIGFEFFQTRWRYENIEIFRYVRSILLEAGVMDFWKHMYRYIHRDLCIGGRHRAQIGNKVDLDFGDMQPAWVALVIGLVAGWIAFLGELIRTWVKNNLKF